MRLALTFENDVIVNALAHPRQAHQPLVPPRRTATRSLATRNSSDAFSRLGSSASSSHRLRNRLQAGTAPWHDACQTVT